MNYSVWYIDKDRWTTDPLLGVFQDERKPFLLSFEDSYNWWQDKTRPEFFEVREVLADGFSSRKLEAIELHEEIHKVFAKKKGVPIHGFAGAAINDHVCPTCQNDKCSKSEKVCWKCGNPL